MVCVWPQLDMYLWSVIVKMTVGTVVMSVIAPIHTTILEERAVELRQSIFAVSV